jgi:hypothetical protein
MFAQMGYVCSTPDTGSDGDQSRMVSPVRTSAFKSLCGEVGRAKLNARPIGAAGVLGCAGDDLVNHDSVERAVNHQGVRDGQHRIAVSNDQRLGLGEAEHQIGSMGNSDEQIVNRRGSRRRSAR